MTLGPAPQYVETLSLTFSKGTAGTLVVLARGKRLAV